MPEGGRHAHAAAADAALYVRRSAGAGALGAAAATAGGAGGRAPKRTKTKLTYKPCGKRERYSNGYGKG